MADQSKPVPIRFIERGSDLDTAHGNLLRAAVYRAVDSLEELSFPEANTVALRLLEALARYEQALVPQTSEVPRPVRFPDLAPEGVDNALRKAFDELGDTITLDELGFQLPCSSARTVVQLWPGSVPDRASADKLRGAKDCDWEIRGQSDDWAPWTLLRYLVEEVLAPSGGRVSAVDDPRLEAVVWWPRNDRRG